MLSTIKFIAQVGGLALRGRFPQARSLLIKKYTRLLRRYYARRKPQGVAIMAESWDYLIILDACRYDYFARSYPRYLSGDLQKRISRGSSTSNWLLENFTGFYDDTVYVSTNPHCSDHEIHGFQGSEHFHHIEHVWKYAWDEKLDTVVPGEVTRAALKLKAQYPDKRMIIHYIQPHGPWIGKTRISGAEVELAPALSTSGDGKWTVDIRVWEMVREGRFDIAKLKQAYQDNLDLVLAEVQQLVAQLDGRIVVSADHGEAFGERFIISHPPYIYTKELIEVPWLVIEKAKQDHPAKEQPAAQSAPEPSSDDDKLTERLRALGYVD
ncbi:MAG: hypothetical protein KDI38_01930 [Calditrichaeota bacterium]|nr:hypothetical protein [Calditrichota bacterium]